ncbi:ribosomal protein S18-alanine N-acetyltransferase [Sphingomonas sp. CGMCC 1.13654]|uniref:Ribosomal protein S18-alanine N-acetyltransferase n=1 Tax=Sphingomonas chungangi TaxID=2683589 RepID=A0A838L8Q7_9SPHN|nr:ribosomal protein S18-alanine N-acetyltransferase [Sphingomonas chungangi]MBA2935065.1 ribosomal protein S18-alanine N-acetyltransferase [Sphingomonas chungangi]MVW54181.1 ribosomal protein S18-alanine N-acetyltransferase [Sphingomonas chungangi]
MSTLHSPATDLIEGGVTDLDEVMATMQIAFDPAFGEAWTRSQCSGILGLNGVWLLLARQDGRAAGFALSRVVLDEAELLLLAVQPAQRRFGIGRALLAAVAEEARFRGAARLHLEMREGNPAAYLYEAAGFAEIGRRKRYYRGRDGSSFDAITLACRL